MKLIIGKITTEARAVIEEAGGIVEQIKNATTVDLPSSNNVIFGSVSDAGTTISIGGTRFNYYTVLDVANTPNE